MKDLPHLHQVESKNLQAVGYRGKELFVRFKGGGLYSYANVSAADYEALLHADSPGRVFRDRIRGKYKHTLHDG